MGGCGVVGSFVRHQFLVDIKTRLMRAVGPLFEGYVYTPRRGLTRGLKRKGGFEFIPFLQISTKEEAFLTGLDLTNQTVYDIGGGRGRFTLFFARAVGGGGSVVTFEPNPENYRRIVDQVALNGFAGVQVHEIGLGHTREDRTLVFRPSDPGRGSANERIQKKTLEHPDAVGVPVELDSLDHQVALHGLPLPDFVKVDVEGLELQVLQGMTDTIRRARPDIFLEVHGTDSRDKFDNALRVVRLLVGCGYSLHHVESETDIDPTNAEIAKEGHLFCKTISRAPRSRPSSVSSIK